MSSHSNINKSFKFLEFVIYLLFLLGPLTGNIINVLFGVLSADFNVTTGELLISIPAFMFPFAITQLLSGAISDIKGRIPVLIFGLILFEIAMLIAALSFTLMMYVIANVIGGLGFGLINPVLIALMTDITSPPKIPKKMGYLGASASLGVGLGPLIASQMILIGWQSIYVLFIVITCFCLIYFVIIKRPPQKIPEESGIGVLLSQISTEWRRLVIILMILSAFLVAHTYIAINIWTSKTIAHAVDEKLTGIVLGLAGAWGALTGIITGYIIKKKGVKIPLIVGSLILLCSLAILIFIGDITLPERFLFLGIGWILAALSGGALFTSITYYSQVLSPERRGVLAGSLTTGYFIGIALVPTSLAPFSKSITGVYLAILMITLLFIVIASILYVLARGIILEKEKSSH